eukprot:5319679-Lingulodinium_polyedra.AAC.1
MRAQPRGAAGWNSRVGARARDAHCNHVDWMQKEIGKRARSTTMGRGLQCNGGGKRHGPRG